MSPKPKPAAVPLSESNIGSQMLRKMGWTGGGIGKDEQVRLFEARRVILCSC